MASSIFSSRRRCRQTTLRRCYAIPVEVMEFDVGCFPAGGNYSGCTELCAARTGAVDQRDDAARQSGLRSSSGKVRVACPRKEKVMKHVLRTIRAKLMFAMGALAVVAASVGILGIYKLSESNTRLEY